MAEVPEAEQSNRQCSTTATTKAAQPRIELGRNFAAKNIEVAALAIRSMSQTSLFSEFAPSAATQYSDWKRSGVGTRSTLKSNEKQRLLNVEKNRSCNDVAHLLNTTRLALMAMEDSVGKTKKGQRKSVTFNNTPLVHEIEFFDASATPESGSHILEEVDEVFSAGSLNDSSSSSQSETEEEDEEEDEEEEDSTSSSSSNSCDDGRSDDNDNHQEQEEEEKETEEQEEEEQHERETPFVDEQSTNKTPSSEPPESVRSTESLARTVRHTQQIDVLSYLEPHRRVNKDKETQRRNRISRDVVLNQLEKRKSISYAHQYGNVLPLSTATSKQISAPGGSNPPSPASIDAQIMQAVLRAKSTALYAAESSSSAHGSINEAPQQSSSKDQQQQVDVSNVIRKDDDDDDEVSYEDCQLHSENTSIDAMQDHCSSSEEEGDQQQAVESAAVSSLATSALAPSPPAPSTPRLSFKASLSEFSSVLMTELESIASKASSIGIKNDHQPTLKNISNTKVDDTVKDTRIHAAGAAGAAVVTKEQPRLEEDCEKQSIASSVWQNISELEPPRPRSPSMQEGRLYVRMMSANNLDFPIDPHNNSLIRCVVSDGNSEYYSDFRPLCHTVHFNYEFCIDVHPNTEFTITLQLYQPRSSSQPNQLQKFLAARKRHRKNSILRYINDFNGAIAQTRVAFHEIEKECRSKLCTASFALVNSWYRFARQGFIASPSKRDKELVPEKAVGKLITHLFFFPSLRNTKATVFPSSLDACEQALNIRRYYSTCWQSGYMSQLGGDVKFWRRRFFTLRGWRLFSSSDAASRPRVVIDLSLAVVLATHNQIIVQRENNLLLSSEDCLAPTSVKNGFRIVFNTGEVIDYFCDTAKEHGRWLDVLQVVIDKIPEWPQWMERDDDDMFTDNNSLLRLNAS